MAKKHENDKGFLVIKMSTKEAVFKCNFGTTNAYGKPIVKDDNTNKIIKHFVYYVAVLNSTFNQTEFYRWYKTAINCIEDIPFEKILYKEFMINNLYSTNTKQQFGHYGEFHLSKIEKNS